MEAGGVRTIKISANKEHFSKQGLDKYPQVFILSITLIRETLPWDGF